MISTLIRSRVESITPPPIGDDEFLVNTENNRIIYPYTKASNIIGLDSSSNIGGGETTSNGIKLDDLIFGSASMNGWAFTAWQEKTFTIYPGLSSGYYLGILWGTIATYNNSNVSVVNNNRYNFIKSEGSLSANINRVRFTNDASGYSEGTCIGMFRVLDTADIQVAIILGHTVTITKGTLWYKFLRLCDVEEGVNI